MSKSVLELDGDLHVINERLLEIDHKNTKQVQLMKERMDSFVDQITSFKKDIYNNQTKLYDKFIENLNDYKIWFKKVENTINDFENVNSEIEHLKKQDERIVNDILSNSKLFTSLRQEVTLKSQFINSCNERLLAIERNFSKFNFDEIIAEIEEIEEEYKNKISNAISKITAKKNNHDLTFYFQPLAYLELTSRTSRLLEAENYLFIGDIICNTNWPVMLPILGKKSIREINFCIEAYGYNKPVECPEYWIQRKLKTGKDFIMGLS